MYDNSIVSCPTVVKCESEETERADKRQEHGTSHCLLLNPLYASALLAVRVLTREYPAEYTRASPLSTCSAPRSNMNRSAMAVMRSGSLHSAPTALSLQNGHVWRFHSRKHKTTEAVESLLRRHISALVFIGPDGYAPILLLPATLVIVLTRDLDSRLKLSITFRLTSSDSKSRRSALW